MADHRELTKNIISDFAEAYSSFGLNPLMGRIVALLIISKDPQSLDDIAESLEMSKGPISQICRRIKERNLIEKVWVLGDRKDYYKATKDIFGKAFENQMGKMRKNIEIAQRYSAETKSIKKDTAQYAHGKMVEMKRFYEMMDQHNKDFLKNWREVHRKEFGD